MEATVRVAFINQVRAPSMSAIDVCPTFRSYPIFDSFLLVWMITDEPYYSSAPITPPNTSYLTGRSDEPWKTTHTTVSVRRYAH